MKTPALILIIVAASALGGDPASLVPPPRPVRRTVVEELPPDPFVINVPYGLTTIGGVILMDSVAVRIDDKKVTFRGKDGKTADLAWEKIPFNLKSKLAADHDRVTALLASDPDAATRKYAPAATARTSAARSGVPTPATPPSGLEGGSYGKREAFKDTDGDGRKFDLNQPSRRYSK